jgi:Transposase
LARWYIGIDWSDQEHAVWVGNEAGECMEQRVVQEAAEELSDFGRWLHERSNADIELWAAIEKPHGRIVEFLLDHNVVVYPVNPKSLDRARDRFRTSGSKSDRFDARVLAEFLRTDHGHLRPLRPSSPEAQELKLLTRDHRRLVKHQTRLVNQLVATLKEFYPLALGVFPDVSAARALDFLEACPSPGATQQMDAADGEGFAREHRLGEAQRQKLEEALRQPRPRVPAHVERAKGRLVRALVAQLREVEEYTREVERFSVAMPLAE